MWVISGSHYTIGSHVNLAEAARSGIAIFGIREPVKVKY